MADRHRRHALIRQLVQNRRIGSQEELGRLLEDFGVTCTQATLSRDLKHLGIARKNTDQGPVYVLDRRTQYIKALRKVVSMEITSVRHNGTLIVLRTLPGRAEGVAGYLDGVGHELILGTVAGDDTVFVAPSDTSRIEELVGDIRQLANLDLSSEDTAS